MAKLTVIEVTSPSCGVCKMMAPMVDKVVSSFTPEELEFRKVVASVDEEADKLVEEHGIQSVPVFLFYKQDGTVERHDGGISFPQLKAKISNCFR